MTSFQRLIVIPQEEYSALMNMQNLREPLTQHYSQLQSQYESEEKENDPYRRLVMQSSTLDQMKQVKEQMRNSLTVSTPKPYQKRAQALYQTVENFLKFNDKGEIYTDDGNVIPGSRLEDLIQHAVRDRRRNMTPTGWTEFIMLLHSHNVPKSFLNRDTLDEMDKVTRAPATVEVELQEPTIKQNRKRLQPSRSLKPSLSSFKKGAATGDYNFLKRFKNG
jgi:cell division protein FtsL